MAALSVAIDCGGMSSRVPNSSANACARARRIGLAATPAHDGDGRVAELLERSAQLGAQHVHAGGHEGRRHLGLGEARVGADVVDDGRLEPREGERVAVGEHGPGKAEHVLTRRGQPVEHRTARVAEAEEAGHLVVGLADGVVDGLAEQLVAARRRSNG